MKSVGTMLQEMVAGALAGSLIFGAGLLMFAIIDCTRSEATTVEKAVVRVADDVCKEETMQPMDPSWVALVCAGERGVTHVLLPRAARAALRPPAAAAPSAAPSH